MISTLRAGVCERDKQKCDAVLKLDDQVDILHDAILEYLRDLRQEPLTDKQSDSFQALMSATVNLKNLANIINNELVAVGKGFVPDEVASKA